MQLHLTNTRLHTNGVVSGLSFNCWPINLSFLNWNVLSTQSCSLIMLSFAYNGAIISMVGLFEKLHHLYLLCSCWKSYSSLILCPFAVKALLWRIFLTLCFPHFSSWPLFKNLLVKNCVGIMLSNSLFWSPLLSSGI